jgi:nesprin-1
MFVYLFVCLFLLKKLFSSSQDHREFLMELDSHKSLMMSINVIGGHLTEHSCNEAKSEETTKRMERLNDDWDKACDRATQWQTTLQTALMQVKQHYCFIVHYFHSKK